MSLLLEALKRAEAAKQQGGQAAGGAPEGIAFESAPPSDVLQPPPQPPLMTRDRLPDITQPLEILSDDLPSSQPSAKSQIPPAAPIGRGGSAAASGRTLRLESEAPPAPPPGALGAGSGEKEAVRQLFEAKGVDYDPYRFIKIVVALAVGVVVAYGGYLYYQLQPRSAMVVNTSPQAPAPAPATPPGPVAAAPTPIIAAPAAPITPAAPPVATEPTPTPPTPVATAPASGAPASGVPVAKAEPVSRPAPRPAPVPAASTAGEPRQPSTAAAAPSTRSGAAGRPAPTARTTSPNAESPVERGYRALESGDLETARLEYQRALATDRSNRDALLGLAAIDMRTQNYAAAEARYLRVLEVDPRDPYAQAGMVTLRGGTDPVQAESRIKNLIATQPDANFLNFTLGNQYAAQARWSEAQAAYFKAYSTDPDNPDFAYNLAVSLDQLRQPRLALEYYQKALAASAGRPAGFARAQVEGRIRELSQ
jgi:Tfp pilus assembly protein PilF